MAHITDEVRQLHVGARQSLAQTCETLAKLAETEHDEATFFERLLELAGSALGNAGGAVWKVMPGDSINVLCRRALPAGLTASEDRVSANAQFVVRCIVSGTMLVVPPAATSENGERSNPIDQTLIFMPVKLGAEVKFVIELVQPQAAAAAPPAAASFVRQLADLSTLFLKNCQLRQLQTRQEIWQQLGQLTDAVHDSLQVKKVCYALANEGRRIVGCDRLSVGLKRGKRCRIVAVSGQDLIDARSVAIRRLEALATIVARTGQAVWYPAERQSLAPQIEAAVDDYVEHAHTKLVGVVPLKQPAATPEAQPELLGVLVVEAIEDTRSTTNWPDRVDALCETAVRALRNAQQHESLFLLPLWRLLGKSRLLVQAKTLPKTVAALIAAVALVAAMIFVPYDFAVHAPGTLQPVLRRQVFAAADGTVYQLFVRHGQHVDRGELLAQLRNTDLDVAITELTGQVAATHEQLASIDRSLVEDARRLSPEERSRLSGQRMELRQRLLSLQGQLELQQHKRQKLQVVSPVAGEVITWNLEERLHERPVRQGQVLLDVADTSQAWELELRVPEDQMGYVAQAQATQGAKLPVTFRLATDPATDYRGQVAEVELAAAIRGEEENVVLVRVSIDRSQLAHLQPGAECRAKVDCGRRSLGFVLLHDLIGFIQSRILFRL